MRLGPFWACDNEARRPRKVSSAVTALIPTASRGCNTIRCINGGCRCWYRVRWSVSKRNRSIVDPPRHIRARCAQNLQPSAGPVPPGKLARPDRWDRSSRGIATRDDPSKAIRRATSWPVAIHSRIRARTCSIASSRLAAVADSSGTPSNCAVNCPAGSGRTTTQWYNDSWPLRLDDGNIRHSSS